MKSGFADTVARLGASCEVAAGVDSDAGGPRIEATVFQRFRLPLPPDGIVVGSTTAAMAAVAGAERAGFRIGRDFDLAAKEAIRFLQQFRREIIVVREDVGLAGGFLARALMAAIERRAPDAGQYLDRPQSVDAAAPLVVLPDAN